MRVRSLLAVVALAIALALPARAQDGPWLFAPGVEVVPGAPGRMVEIALPVPGARVAVPFTTGESGTLRAEAFFPPPALGAVTMGLRDAAGNVVAADRQTGIVPAGDYIMLVAAEGHAPQRFTVKVELEPPLDPFEVNDVRADATPVELPFDAAIQMDAQPRADWFTFEIEEAGVLVMHLSTPQALDGPMFRLSDAGETEIYATQDRFGYRGARFARVEPGRYWLEVWDRADRGADAPESIARLMLEYRAPEPAASGSPGVSAVGLPESSPEFGQLAILGLITGLEVLVTVTAEDVAEAIETAIGAPDWTLTIAVLVLLLLAGTVWAAWYWRSTPAMAASVNAALALAPHAEALARRTGTSLRSLARRGFARARRDLARARPAARPEAGPDDMPVPAGPPQREVKTPTRTRWRANDDEAEPADARKDDVIPAGSSALLEVVEGPGAGVRIYVTETEARIGRARANEIPLNFGDDRIHRQGHGILRIYRDTATATLSPDRDEPVTHVNGEPLIATRELRDGDRIALGKTVLRYTALFGPES